MTQPVQAPPWIEMLLQRGRDTPPVEYTPQTFEVRRQPFDVSSYMRELDTIRNLSQTGTKILNQKLANQQRLQQQQQAIDFQNVTPQYTGAARSGAYSSPLGSYNIASGYGPRKRPTAGASTYHRGVDLAAPMGAPIYATHSGYVSGINNRGGYGNSITLNASNGIQTFYGHNSRNVVKRGQFVRQGQLIGYVGSTGISTGPHVHYGVMINGNWINPQGYF